MKCLIEGWPIWLETWDHVGSIYPYYVKDDYSRVFMTIDKAISEIRKYSLPMIDPAGIIELLSNSYLFANRTLVRGIAKIPWMCIPLSESYWQYSSIPEHGNNKMAAREIAARLKNMLLDEAKRYVSNCNTIGILLSGGLDSRIAAGVLRELQEKKEYSGEIKALTWGLSESRDFIYAKEIARRYDWEFIHYPLDNELIKKNIQICGEKGAELSPIHLHAIPLIAARRDLDAVIVGSYGDSIGRGEYSGVHFEELKQTVPKRIDRFYLLKRGVCKDYVGEIRKDAYGYRRHVPGRKEMHYREIEQQMHYLRRKWQTCMMIIAENIPVYQMFTAKNLVGMMWNLSPKSRTNEAYIELLQMLPGGVSNIPWARTGIPLGKKTVVDSYCPQYHKYGKWLRQDLYSYIENLVRSSAISELGIFSEKGIEDLLKAYRNADTVSTNRIDEILTWLASLSVFIDRYDIDSCKGFREERRKVERIYAYLYTRGYIFLRNKVRL